MSGMFGGGGSKKKSSGSTDPKSTTADSIETADGTVYDRRGTTTAADNMPATPPAVLTAPAQPMAQAGSMSKDPMEGAMPSIRTRKRMPSNTLAGQSGYGFG